MLLTILIVLLWFLASLAFLKKSIPSLNPLLAASLAFILSNALLSILFVVSVFIHLPEMVMTFLYLGTPIGIGFWSIKKTTLHQNVLTKNSKSEFIFLCLSALIIYQFTSSFLSQASYWGNWDAWAIWNVHAKFLVQENYFHHLFSNKISWTHSDYPLLLPGLIAFYWKGIHAVEPFTPLLIAYFTCVCVLVIGFTSMAQKGHSVFGLLFMYILANQDILLPIGATQYADTFLALFMLIVFVLYHLLEEGFNKTTIVLLGFFAASCGWIKNEGLLFFIVFSIPFLLKHLTNKKALLHYFLGAAIPLLVLFYFKTFLAPSNDLIGAKNNDILYKLSDKTRYQQVWDFMYQYIKTNNQILLYLLLFAAIFNRKFFSSFGFLVISMLFIGYFMVYVITPNDLIWHLNTSFDRLLHHISPALIFLLLLGFGNVMNIDIVQKTKTLLVKKTKV